MFHIKRGIDRYVSYKIAKFIVKSVVAILVGLLLIFFGFVNG